MFKKEFRVRGEDVGWDATWDQSNNLSVVIYDYGKGVTFHGLAKDEPPRRVFRKLFYRFDSKTGTFTEQPAK
ncbi:hypothetical protein [Pedosphaera parvula]|uniref:hypothetical protein n=1 Tax=Pedosphaera parvula TaxID=1032527 RepID=UPI0002D3003C|nr:hypothetical protein [Pedosphaera parvula]